MTNGELDKILTKHESGIVVLANEEDGVACGFKGDVSMIMVLIGMTMVEIHKVYGEDYEKLGRILNDVVSKQIEYEHKERGEA